MALNIIPERNPPSGLAVRRYYRYHGLVWYGGIGRKAYNGGDSPLQGVRGVGEMVQRELIEPSLVR